MTLLLLLLPLLVLLALPAALVWAYKKLGLQRFVLLNGAIALAAVGLWKYHEGQFILEVVPDALEVRTVSYRLEESWGFGPGGNEAGIRFYPLPDHVARAVENGGARYLEQLPPNTDQQSRDWRGLYGEWRETPVQGDHWKVDPATGLLNVTDYICAYGFCIDIPSDHLKQANEVVSKPGSFYARGRIGMIVVSPARRWVLYFYNG
jgi:hypothetical protein